MVSTYFEALACSDITGIHFVHRRPPIKGDEQAIKFFSAFPTVRVHPKTKATNFFFLGNTWRKTCPAIWPHPHTWAGAWNQRPALIADVIHTAIKAVFEDVKTATVPVESFTHIVPAKSAGSHLPLVPSAAIMFRCVDILHYVEGQPYGFLNFNVYTQLIPKNVTTIYVLSEPLNYMDHASSNQKNCKEIGDFLVTFLHTQFPASTVALRRGFPIDSVAIMANTPMLISAPSTFALFPGIANPNKVYTTAGLLYFDTPYLGDNFKWIKSPALIYPGSHVHVNRDGAVKKLKALFTTPLEKEVEALSAPHLKYNQQIMSAKMNVLSSPSRNRATGMTSMHEVKSGIFLSDIKGGAGDVNRKKTMKVVRTKSGNFKKAMESELDGEKDFAGDAGTRVTSSYARVLLAGSGFLADAYDLFVINLVLRLLRN
eukprot:gene12514-14474_t